MGKEEAIKKEAMKKAQKTCKEGGHKSSQKKEAARKATVTKEEFAKKKKEISSKEKKSKDLIKQAKANISAAEAEKKAKRKTEHNRTAEIRGILPSFHMMLVEGVAWRVFHS